MLIDEKFHSKDENGQFQPLVVEAALMVWKVIEKWPEGWVSPLFRMDYDLCRRFPNPDISMVCWQFDKPRFSKLEIISNCTVRALYSYTELDDALEYIRVQNWYKGQKPRALGIFEAIVPINSKYYVGHDDIDRIGPEIIASDSLIVFSDSTIIPSI